MKATTTTTTKTTLTEQLMREAVDYAMNMIAQLEEAIEDYDHQLTTGQPVDQDDLRWMHKRVLELEHAVKGFGLL